MKAFKLSYVILLAVALVFSSVTVFAQQNDSKDVEDEEVIIIKEIVDEDGNVEVKTITRSGDTEDIIIETIADGEIKIHTNLDELEDIHVIKLEELEGLSDELEEKLKNIEINIDEDELNRKIKIIMDKKGEDGEPVIIEWEGDGDIPEDIKKELEENGVEFDGNGGFGHAPSHGFMMKKGKHPKNKACLGVMIGKTVENVNGVETVHGETDLGVTVLDIIEDSGAEAAGLLKDDIITAVNGEDVASIHDVLDVLKPYSGGETIVVEYLRDNQPAQVNATLKACENKMKIKHFESHGDNNFEFKEENNWVFEKEVEGEDEIKRTIIIKKELLKIPMRCKKQNQSPLPKTK